MFDPDVRLILLLVLFFAVGTAVLVGATVAYDAYECGVKTEAMGKKHTWGFVQGCMVQTKDGYVPLKQYRSID